MQKILKWIFDICVTLPAIIKELLSDIGLETRLRSLTTASKQSIREIVAKEFNPERAKNNPRMLKPDALEKIVDSIY